MNDPTASKQYVLNQFGPADITTGTFVDGGYTWTYKKVGNLYFAFAGVSGGGLHIIIGSDSFAGAFAITNIKDTIDHFASILGVTVNTYYPTDLITGADFTFSGTGLAQGVFAWNGANYVNTNGNIDFLMAGFLAN